MGNISERSESALHSANFQGLCKTTAMGILPHTDVERAMQLALSLDIPFWPQLPLASFSEDMWAQMSAGFPGITVHVEKKRVSFDTNRFLEGLSNYSAQMSSPEHFAIDDRASLSYRKFLGLKLDEYAAIRGQVIGPLNFGFRIPDENKKPIIYNEDVRVLLFDFIQRKLNFQYKELTRKNGNAFIWLDEPGLGWVFSSFSGYNDYHAKTDLLHFFAGIQGPKALHLCINVNLPYLLGLGIDILSIDAYEPGIIPKAYAAPVADFLKGGGIISWGIAPTSGEGVFSETPDTLVRQLTRSWDVITENSDISAERIARQSLIAPAKCCIINAVSINVDSTIEKGEGKAYQINGTEESNVEKAFHNVRKVSSLLKKRFAF